MSRTKELFAVKKQNVLNIYCTAGFPELNSTVPVMKLLQQNGADIIELGMPYSDPLADGPVIQESSSQAIANGMTIKTLFEQLKDFRKEITIPVLLMGYMNPVLQYGFEQFCADAAAVGIDGLIIPDLPVYEFETEYGAIIKKYGLDFTFMVTPETPADRLHKLDELTSGFLYAVSSSATTGNNAALHLQETYFASLQQAGLKSPFMIGFGIKDKASFQTASQYANGAIIGTAFIRSFDKNQPVEQTVKAFMQTVL